jgi:2-polyprenyl-3-methyl-5-hydroxy-6-metoxy-1,4-benzoquinol methylase
MRQTVAVEYADIYDPDQDFDSWYTRLTARRIDRRLAPADRILELGSATGLMTSLLARDDREIVCVERSTPYVIRARARGLRNVSIVHGMIEDYQGDGAFDHVLAINLLHEIPDLDPVMRRVIALMKPAGLLHVALPNPHSLHRLVALEAGLIESLCEISERGKKFSTLRLFPAEEFIERAAGWGLACLERSSILVKPLPNAEMARLPDAIIKAFDAVTATLPDLGSMNYFVFRKAPDA